jgi:hypothetical protein
VASDADEPDQAALLKTFLATVQHFFGSFTARFVPVTDPRQPELITYPLAALLFAGLWLWGLGARRQIGQLLRGKGPAATKFEALFGVAACPHGDTLNVAFSRLTPAERQAVVTGLIATLIRRKVLSAPRRLDHDYLIAIDGTGVLVFAERHCAHCLTRPHHGGRPTLILFWKPNESRPPASPCPC